MKDTLAVSELRKFGLVVGGIFVAIGCWPVVARAQPSRLWAVCLGVALVILGLAVPKTLRFGYRMWTVVGEILGWINVRVVLGVIFFGLLTPIGWMRRRLGRDALRLQGVPDSKTYRAPRQARPATHMKRQF